MLSSMIMNRYKFILHSQSLETHGFLNVVDADSDVEYILSQLFGLVPKSDVVFSQFVRPTFVAGF